MIFLNHPAIAYFKDVFRHSIFEEIRSNSRPTKCFSQKIIKNNFSTTNSSGYHGTTSLSVLEVWGSNSGPVKSDSVVKGSLPLPHFFAAALPRRHLLTCYTLRRNRTSVMKILIKKTLIVVTIRETFF